MTDPDILRERMLKGFLPDADTLLDQRAPRALEYIAFYLGEINNKLGQIAEAMKKEPGG